MSTPTGMVKILSMEELACHVISYIQTTTPDRTSNKWFMSKVSKYPVKIWNKEDKRYKLKIRMLEKDAVNEYSDLGLYGSCMRRKASVKSLNMTRFLMLLEHCKM